MQALGALVGFVLAVSIPSTGMGSLPTAWQARDSGTSNRLNGVAYGNGMYVAVGEHGTAVTSIDGTNWVHRSLGENAELLCVTHGGGRFVAGGEEGVLRSSTDGTNWTNGITPPGVEHIYGVTYGYGLFVAVGQVEHNGTNYILTSSNGLDWVARDVPTTNTLFAVTPAFNHQGGWESGMYAAVGDNGTIVTSGGDGGVNPDGIEWTTDQSGTPLDLGTATFHGGLVVGSGSAILRKTSASGPWERRGGVVPFTIRGLASSGEALVAAGADGRLAWSIDIGLWPEDISVFPQGLHAICFGGGRFVAVGNQGWIMTSEGSVDNLWTKPTSGSWEESFWSLDRLPGQEQTVRISNDGVKELAISAATTANYPESLSVQNLILEGSNNLLRLDWAGKAVPLRIASDLRIGSGAALQSHSSAIEAAGLTLSGRVMLDNESMASFDSSKIGAYGPGELIISNATLVVSNRMDIGDTAPGIVTQYGGTNRIGGIMVVYSQGSYHLKGGTLELRWVEAIGYDPDAEFVVSGGTMRAGHIGLQGTLLMEGGTIETDTVGYHTTGSFRQTGGHTTIRRGLSIPDDYSPGGYFLEGGTLISSNVSIGWTMSHGTFGQTSGVHTNGNLTIWGHGNRYGGHDYSGDYKLSGGLLVSDRVRVEGGLFYHLGGTNLAQQVETTDSGGYILSNGVLRAFKVVVTNIPDPYRSRRGFMEVYGGEAHIDHELRIESPSNFRLVSGTLSVSNIFVGGNLMAWVPLTHSGTITLARGALSLGTNQTYDFGPLGLSESGSINLPQEGTAVVRFDDSRDTVWTSGGTLTITNWSGSTNGGGAHRVFVGSNGEGLSASQLRQVWFRNPAGFSAGDHPARILASGEIVPVERTVIAAATMASGLRLSWSGGYELFTATNVAGPYVRVNGATSPYTNSLGEQQRFFQLRSTAP